MVLSLLNVIKSLLSVALMSEFESIVGTIKLIRMFG